MVIIIINTNAFIVLMIYKTFNSNFNATTAKIDTTRASYESTPPMLPVSSVVNDTTESTRGQFSETYQTKQTSTVTSSKTSLKDTTRAKGL